MEKNIQKVDKSYFPEAAVLADAIEGNDYNEAMVCIKTLIKKQAFVKLTFKEKKYLCDSHSYYFPNEPNKYGLNSLSVPFYCAYFHKFCNDCILEYVKEKFSFYYLEYNYYQCIYCDYYNVPGTLLLDYNILESVFLHLFGEERIYSIRAFSSAPKEITVVTPCSICGSTTKYLFIICRAYHNICSECVENWAKSATEIKCLVNACEQDAICSVLITVLENSPTLSKLKEPLKKLSISINICPKCNLLVSLDLRKKITKCRCGQDICNNCERPAHFETCFFFESNQEFEVIDLSPPEEIGKPKSLREQEYLNAKYAFDHFLEDKSYSHYFKSAKLIVNKELEKRYAAKKKKMIQECGGEDKIGEVYIWHGSSIENYDMIMKEGLKVGGVDFGVNIAQGKVHGYGIYSATTPDTPILYSKNSGFIIACLAMKGIESKTMINDPAQLDLGLTHCYKPIAAEAAKNWWVFFTKEQVLPRFLVEYGS